MRNGCTKASLFKDISKENKSAAATGHGKTYDTGTLSGAWQAARHCGCGSAGIASWNNRNGQKFFQSLLGKYILTGYTDHVQLNLGEPENLEMVAIEDNEKNTMEIGAEPDSEEDFEFVCRKPQWVPEGYTLEQEEYYEDFHLYQKTYVNRNGKSMLYQQMCNDTVDNLGISSSGNEQQKVMIKNSEGYFIPDNALDEEKGNLVWEDGRYLYIIVGNFTKEELVKIAETVK